MPISAILKLEKITAATVEILDRFRHPGFSVFQGSAIQPDDTGAREKPAVYIPPAASGFGALGMNRVPMDAKKTDHAS